MSFCNRCGATVPDGADACPSCGQALAGAVPPPASALRLPPAEPTAPRRPAGVTIVATVLLVFTGFFILGGLILLAVGSALGAAFFQEVPFLGPLAGAFLLVAFLSVATVAAIGIAIGVGLLQGRMWAWVGFLVLAGLNVLTGLLDLAEGEVDGVLGLLVWGGVGAYFAFSPEVRAWFRARTA